jgi:hypothetical protein
MATYAATYAELLQRLKAVWSEARKEEEEPKLVALAIWLRQIVDLTFESRTALENMPEVSLAKIPKVKLQEVNLLVLKAECKNLAGNEPVVGKVAVFLKGAYDAYHEGCGRPLDYDYYPMFVRACQQWGSRTQISELSQCRLETEEEQKQIRKTKTAEEQKKETVEEMLVDLKSATDVP